ncbi:MULTISPECIES: MurR/RpiR family transcriptional regulator [unclassified Oceanobacillus]|uniref:MurR/RpiR family transcriptional regulator n=1 Tax=unclassified Oceanobacillus TaxID=2630292 RepID=UPI00300E2CCA
MNENDLSVLQYVLSNKDKCYNLSINELADICFVSRSSIHRLAKKLDFNGFSEFKTFLKWESQSEYHTGNLSETLHSDILQTFKNLNTVDFRSISEILLNANRIFIHGTGTAQQFCAAECQRMFSIIQTYLILIHDQVEFDAMYRGMNASDVVITISLSGDTPEIASKTKQLNAKGVTVITITNLQNNKLAQMSPYNIYVTTTEELTTHGLGITSFVPFYIAIEKMYREFIVYANC